MKGATSRLLVVEDDTKIREIVKFRLKRWGFQVHGCATAREALEAFKASEFDVVLLDIGLPDRNGISLLKEMRKISSLTQVIIVTASAKIENATQALRYGAMDYITKPIDFPALQHSIGNAVDRVRGLRQELAVQRLVESQGFFSTIFARSQAMLEVVKLVGKVAESHVPVLLIGESGSGKELIARTIHLRSPRNNASFLPINCGSLPESLLESELFGHEKGAFTGADEVRRGLFEVAHMGTLFLDEIGEMSLGTQVSFLRVLESGEFRRVGGKSNRHADVRIVAATNRDLKAAVSEKTFRKDLYYRLNTVTINIPALRDRQEDIWPIAEHFAEVLSRDTGKSARLSEDIRPYFERYAWPGNVRELRNMVERLILLADREEIDIDQLPHEVTEPGWSGRDESLADVERRHISKVLVRAKGNRREAAKVLGVGEATLYRKIKSMGLDSAPL